MPQHQLRETLIKLEEELRSGAVIEDEDRELLAQVTRDLQNALAESAPKAVADDDSLRERIQNARDRFKARHPGLAHFLGAALDALNRLGV